MILAPMFTPLPELPDLNWFEVEILYFLRDRERYGNEMLSILKDHLGEESVSSGKLYSDLKKMEKKKFIVRTKKKRQKGEGLMTRGVDRIYFRITDEGRKSLEKAERYMFCWQFDSMLKRSSEKIPLLIEQLVFPLGTGITVGAAVDPSKLGITRAIDLLPDLDGVEYALLLMAANGVTPSMPRLESIERKMASFPARVDDIPLKDDYLDAVISVFPLTRTEREMRYLSELIRIVKPGGIIIIIDFSKLDSYILEDVFRSQLGWSKEDLKGHDSRGIGELLSEQLKNVDVKRFKEQYVAWGKK
jgi:DNA-binding PadR family transcriptional regulator